MGALVGAPRDPWMISWRRARFAGMTWPGWSLADVLAKRPAVRVDQLGYLPGRPVKATFVCAATEPVPVALLDGGGRCVEQGRSARWTSARRRRRD